MDETISIEEPVPAPRALDLLCRVLLGVATALIILVAILLVAQVAARNIWNIGLPRAEELMRLAGVLVVYTTAPVLALRGQHVAVDVFINLLPRLPRAACLVIAELSMMLFCTLTVYGGWLYLQRAWKFKTAALGLPNIYLYAPIMACFVLLFIISAWRIATIVRTERATP